MFTSTERHAPTKERSKNNFTLGIQSSLVKAWSMNRHGFTNQGETPNSQTHRLEKWFFKMELLNRHERRSAPITTIYRSSDHPQPFFDSRQCRGKLWSTWTAKRIQVPLVDFVLIFALVES